VAGILRLRGVLVPFGKLDVEHAGVFAFVGTNPVLSHPPLTMPSQGRRAQSRAVNVSVESKGLS
jgi:hypothetical protein